LRLELLPNLGSIGFKMPYNQSIRQLLAKRRLLNANYKGMVLRQQTFKCRSKNLDVTLFFIKTLQNRNHQGETIVIKVHPEDVQWMEVYASLPCIAGKINAFRWHALATKLLFTSCRT
jgi:hypothetical protein